MDRGVGSRITVEESLQKGLEGPSDSRGSILKVSRTGRERGGTTKSRPDTRRTPVSDTG